MKYRSTWDKYIYALLINAYLDIRKDSSRRVLILRALDKEMEKIGFSSSSLDINQKLGKLEFLMTQGERGTPGVPFPDMQEMVSIYEKDKELFQLYVEAACKNTTIERLQEKKEKEKAASLEEGTPRYQAVIEGYRTNAAIDTLLFSKRIVQALQNHQVHTVRELLDCTEEEFAQMKHIGQKSLADMLAVLAILQKEKARMAAVKASVQQETVDILQAEDVVEKVKVLLAKGIGVETPICDLPISVRSKNVLHDQNIETLNQLETLEVTSWEDVHACGTKTQEEIKSLYGALYLLSSGKTLKEIIKRDESNTTPLSSDSKQETAEDMEEKANAWIAKGIRLETPIYDLPISIRSQNALHRQKIETLKQLETVDITSWQNVQGCGRKTQEEIKSLYSIVSLLPSGESLEEIIPLEEPKPIPTLSEFVEGLEKEQYRLALHYRLAGEKLEEIGIRLGVTRERIRQVITKILSKRPQLQEDAFIPVWDTYRALNDEDYGFLFGLSKEVLNYFRMVSKSHTGTNKQIRFDCLRQIIHDYAENEEVVSKAKKLLKESKVFVLIDGEKIEKNRPALLRYAVQTYCQEEMPLEEFEEKYNALLQCLGLQEDSKFTISDNRGVLNHLANTSYVLWCRGRKLRYYDISSVDGQVIIDDIGISSYKDIEISTQKFFIDYPDVMKEYDIRNAYEMHNLLKKIWDRDQLNQKLDKHHQVTFGRMPMISIGQADRKKQVMELIQNRSPIKVYDLAEAYEDMYGVMAQTVAANFFVGFEKYLNHDTYSVNWTPLPTAIWNRMKSLLTEDFYFLDEVYDIFQDEFPGENVWILNPFTLKSLGYMTYSNYILRDTYHSAVDFFRYILQQPVADLRDQAYLMSINAFYSETTKERQAFDIVEAEPLVFNSREYLEEKGITKDQFYEFWHLIENYVKEDEFFTIYSLKKRGLSLPWQEQYFRNWFYSSVLLEDRESFTYKRYGECRLFRKTTKAFTLKDFLRAIADGLDREIEFHELTYLLQDTYGFCPQDSSLKEIIAADYYLSERIAVY